MDDVQIVAAAEHLGVREGRRIHGLYRVTMRDLVDGALWGQAGRLPHKGCGDTRSVMSTTRR